jgi:predicted MFS family arabinose efflux permease
MVAATTALALVTASGAATYVAAAAIVMVSGAFWTTDMPVRRRLLVDAVGSDSAPAALGFDNATQYATRAIGPLIGGAAYQVLGISGIYVLIATSYLACLLLALRVGVRSESPSTGSPARRGLGFLVPPELIDRRFQVIMGVTMVYNLWCGRSSAWCGDRPEGLRTDPGQVGRCRRATGSAAARSRRPASAKRTLFRFYFFGALLCSCSSGAAPDSAASVGILLWWACAAALLVHPIRTRLHMAPPEMRGRAAGVLSIFIGSSIVGHWHAGLLFERLGSVWAMQVMAIEGLAAMVALGLLWWRAPPPRAA